MASTQITHLPIEKCFAQEARVIKAPSFREGGREKVIPSMVHELSEVFCQMLMLAMNQLEKDSTDQARIQVG